MRVDEVEAVRRMMLSGSTDIKAILEAREKVYAWVLEVPDLDTRKVLYLRYMRCYGWEQVAIAIGDGWTAEAVRKRASRYVARTCRP